MRKNVVVAGAAMSLALVCIVVVAWRAPRASKAITPQSPIKIIINQLPAVNGVIPVEIVGAKITDEVGEDQQPSPLGSLTFGVRNNTAKPMNAVVIKVEAELIRSDGKTTESARWFTLNQAIHPDIVAHHGQRPIAPGQVFSPGPESITLQPPLTGVKSFTFTTDYADFADGSAVGPNLMGTERVVRAREGAAQYKAWLVGQWLQSGRSATATAALLRTQQGPPLAGGEQSGAFRYRKHLSDAYDMHGAAVFTQYLEARR
jgi:hypothetical protein